MSVAAPSLAAKRALSRQELIIAAGVAAAFIFGCLAYVLILPPHEGFDEPGHYSYISFLADERQIPDLHTARVDVLAEYASLGIPLPYHSDPPYDRPGEESYAAFFARVDRSPILWQAPSAAVRYSPGRRSNWEAQQPPLYYGVMVPAYELSRSFSPGDRLLVLRLVSIALASASLAVWVKTIALFDDPRTRRLLLYAGLLVLFFPGVYFDLARVGNDSLAALLGSIVMYFLFAAYAHRQQRWSDVLGISIALGLGLLTKVFFVAIAGGALVVYLWMGISRGLDRSTLMRHLAVLVVVPLLISGWWFALAYARYGMFFPSEEMLGWQRNGAVGLSAGPVQFLSELARASRVWMLSVLWSGTWSWVRPPLPLYLAFVPIAVLAALGWVRMLRQGRAGETVHIAAIGAVLVAAFIGLLGYHAVSHVWFTGYGSGTPGYYLFLLWPAVGLILAPVFSNAIGVGRWVAISSLGLVLAMEIAGWWLLILIYSGLAAKSQSVFGGTQILAPTVDRVLLAISHLQELAFPVAALVCFAGAISLRVGVLLYAASRR